MRQIELKQKENEPQVPFEVIAQDIEKISHAMELIAKTRISQKMLIVLIGHHTKIGSEKIKVILNALGELESIYLKPKPVKAKKQ